MAIRRQIEPRFTHPDMERREAMQALHSSLPECEKLLATYIIEPGPVLDNKMLEVIEGLRSTAESSQFESLERGGFDEQLADETATYLKRLQEAE